MSRADAHRAAGGPAVRSRVVALWDRLRGVVHPPDPPVDRAVSDARLEVMRSELTRLRRAVEALDRVPTGRGR